MQMKHCSDGIPNKPNLSSYGAWSTIQAQSKCYFNPRSDATIIKFCYNMKGGKNFKNGWLEEKIYRNKLSLKHGAQHRK